jgi:hypothetical protein
MFRVSSQEIRLKSRESAFFYGSAGVFHHIAQKVEVVMARQHGAGNFPRLEKTPQARAAAGARFVNGGLVEFVVELFRETGPDRVKTRPFLACFEGVFADPWLPRSRQPA